MSGDGPGGSRGLLRRIVGAPDLLRAVRALSGAELSAVMRRLGLEDAGELLALASTEQLVAAFDEELFANARPGERETLDAARFATWLEVLLEAGEGIAAEKVAGLPEELVAHALCGLLRVLDHDALADRMGEGGAPARAVDKALEGCLSEELDGYLLVSRVHDGWDAALALVLALDREHRPFLERVLDRCAAVASGYLDDLDELATALSAGDSLAEDVEAEREERRARQGYVEPRAARAFLALARLPEGEAPRGRDPVTLAHLRDLARAPAGGGDRPPAGDTVRLLRALAEPRGASPRALPAPLAAPEDGAADDPLVGALRLLRDGAPATFGERMEELAYLANVLVAGAPGRGATDGRLRPVEAVEAALATVELGAELLARRARRGRPPTRGATAEELAEQLRAHPADLLFRAASRALAAGAGDRHEGFLRGRGPARRGTLLRGEATRAVPKG